MISTVGYAITLYIKSNNELPCRNVARQERKTINFLVLSILGI